MTKTEKIIGLLAQGLSPKDIACRVGSTHNYVLNVRTQVQEQKEIDHLFKENEQLKRKLAQRSE